MWPMNHEKSAVVRSRARARRRPHWLRPRSLLSTLALVAGVTTGVALTTLAVAPVAHAAPTTPAAGAVHAAPAKPGGTAPAAPSGWATVFSDNFAGAAGSPPSSANWFYDIGTGYGTGEVENTTDSTSNVYLDGNGHLDITAIDNGGTWTSGRIESTRDDFEAPAGGEMEMTASIEQPNVANETGYWPAFWALGSPGRMGGTWPTEGEIDMMEDVNGLNEASQTLHDSAGSSGSPLTACSTTPCESGYNTYSVIVNRVNTSAEYLEFLMDGTVTDTITEASVGTAAWQDAIDHGFFIIFDLAMGGNYPDPLCDCTAPTSSTTSGGTMSVAYVAVYEEGGNSTPTQTVTSSGPITGYDGLCLTNANSLNTEANPMEVSTCNSSSGQAWSVYSNGTLGTEGGCLDVVGAGTTSGTDIDWYPCNATPAQNWTHESNGELLNPNSGLCLTDPGGNPSTQLELETCADTAEQIWVLPSSTANTVTVTNPGSQTSTVGTAASLQVSGSDSASGQTLTYSASGLPAGLSISSTGLISGTPTTAGTSSVTVTATDTTGASGDTVFSWTVNAASSSGSTLTITASTYAAASSGVMTQATSDTGGGNNVGWLGNGSWLEYTGVNFGSGYPQIEARIASAYTGDLGTISFEIGSLTATPFATITVDGTGGWQTWDTTTPVANSPEPSGTQTLYVSFATSTGTNFVNVNWFALGSLSSSSSTVTVTASTYAAASSGVATQATSDTGGGDNVGWLGNGSWLEYTGVNFGSGLTGKVVARVASAVSGTDIGTISFSIGSQTATPFATIDVNGTGGWQTWVSTTPVTAAPVPSGTQTLYVTFTTSTGANFVNVNWFQFS
jgi:Carbohydrate binding module (family 6)/Ricin-type beta-trefoil lectin domain/Putative Ig domain